MEEGEKKPGAGTTPGIPQNKIVYVILAAAVVILAVVLIAKFGYNTDLLSPAGSQSSFGQLQDSLVHPGITYSGQHHAGITDTNLGARAGIVHQPSCDANQSDCSGTCEYLMTDSQNCGSCGFSCTPGYSCQNGNCISDPTCAGVMCSAGNSCCEGVCISNADPDTCAQRVASGHATENIVVSWENHSIKV